MSKNWADFEDDEDSPFVAPIKAPVLPDTLAPLEAAALPDGPTRPVLYISNLKFEVFEDDIEELVKKTCDFEVDEVLMIFEGKKNNGYATVYFKSLEDAQVAFEKCNDAPVLGRNIRIALEATRHHKRRSDDASDQEDDGWAAVGGAQPVEKKAPKKEERRDTRGGFFGKERRDGERRDGGRREEKPAAARGGRW